MRILGPTFAATLGITFVSVGVAVSSPAYADKCDNFRPPGSPPNELASQCEHDKPVGSGTPVCQQPTGPTGAAPDCWKCMSAISTTDGNVRLQAAFDCGAAGGAQTMDGLPHCMVGNVPTGRIPPACSGDLQADGTVADIPAN